MVSQLNQVNQCRRLGLMVDSSMKTLTQDAARVMTNSMLGHKIGIKKNTASVKTVLLPLLKWIHAAIFGILLNF